MPPDYSSSSIASIAKGPVDQATALATKLPQKQNEMPTEPSLKPVTEILTEINLCLDLSSDAMILSDSERVKLDSIATGLWNSCRERVTAAYLNDNYATTMICGVLATTIAFLDLASPFTRSDNSQLESALRILRSLARRLDTVNKHVPSVDKYLLDSVSAEYHMLRAHLAWKQGNTGLVDHFLNKIPPNRVIRNHYAIAEGYLYIGRSELEVGQYDHSIKWLELALSHLSAIRDGEKWTYLRSTAWAYMAAESYDQYELFGPIVALNLLRFLPQFQYENVPAVQVLELEYIRRKVGYSRPPELAEIAEYTRVAGLLLGCTEHHSHAADYLLPLTWLSMELEHRETVDEGGMLDLASAAVLDCTKNALKRPDMVLSDFALQSACVELYNLTLFISNLFPDTEAVMILENSQKVLELAKQHIETRRGANDEHEYVSGTETPALELTSSQIDFVACQFLFLEISIRDQLVQSCSDEEVQREHYKKILEAIKSIHLLSHKDHTRAVIDDETSRTLGISQFEAVIALKEWGAVPEILSKSEQYLDVPLFEYFMNCILQSAMPAPLSASSLHSLLSIGRERVTTTMPTRSYTEVLPTCLKNLYTFALAAARSSALPQFIEDVEAPTSSDYYWMAEYAVDEMLSLAAGKLDSEPRDRSQEPNTHPNMNELTSSASSRIANRRQLHPVKELEYLATCTFNQAMYFYSAEDDEACLRWAEKAGQLAKLMGTSQGDYLMTLFEDRLGGLF
ncbi:hypothetical protein PDE_03228 [Penicillium oxalicum 114-2]|uniref:Protein ZIP4 homolog n=1 Tax=Penicillium oxalicum (strain 114-2 / CGMCC 5302) TaxID=933388 RepID=S8B1P9_PENO1|nr:hypothetical protein PDE_03228 [Penicillium oxalicum 114-2]